MYIKASWNDPCAAPLAEWTPLCWVCWGEHKVRAAKMFCSINKITSSYRGSPPAVIQFYKKSVIWAGCLSLNTWMSQSAGRLKGHSTPNWTPCLLSNASGTNWMWTQQRLSLNITTPDPPQSLLWRGSYWIYFLSTQPHWITPQESSMLINGVLICGSPALDTNSCSVWALAVTLKLRRMMFQSTGG